MIKPLCLPASTDVYLSADLILIAEVTVCWSRDDPEATVSERKYLRSETTYTNMLDKAIKMKNIAIYRNHSVLLSQFVRSLQNSF